MNDAQKYYYTDREKLTAAFYQEPGCSLVCSYCGLLYQFGSRRHSKIYRLGDGGAASPCCLWSMKTEKTRETDVKFYLRSLWKQVKLKVTDYKHRWSYSIRPSLEMPGLHVAIRHWPYK